MKPTREEGRQGVNDEGERHFLFGKEKLVRYFRARRDRRGTLSSSDNWDGAA